MRLLFCILLALVVLLAVSCTSRSGRRKTTNNVSTVVTKYERTFQVMYEDGRMENIKDDKKLPFMLGDTIVIRKYAYVEKGEKLYSNEYIYGKYIPGKSPGNTYTDTSYSESHIAVIKRILLP